MQAQMHKQNVFKGKKPTNTITVPTNVLSRSNSNMASTAAASASLSQKRGGVASIFQQRAQTVNQT